MNQIDIDNILLEAETVEVFLQRSFKLFKTNRRGFSYHVFAKKAGFSSPSYIREVVHGKKRITLKAFPRFCKALSLAPLSQEYLKLLLAQTAQEFNEGNLSAPEIKNSLSALKRKIHSLKHNQELSLINLKNHPQREKCPTVYAALGGEDGATFEEVLERVNIPRDVVTSLIEAMLESEIISFDQRNQKYSACHDFLYSCILKEKNFLQEFFLHEMSEIEAQARKDFHSEKSLFFVSTISVNESDMPKLKKELTELLLKFSTTALANEGTTVAKIACGFIN